MTRKQFIASIARQAGLTQAQTARAYECTMGMIAYQIIAHGECNLRGFGKWRVVRRGPRKGYNLATGKVVPLPAKNYVRFYPGKRIRQALNVPGEEPCIADAK